MLVSNAFCLSLVFLFILFRIARWSSSGKELPSLLVLLFTWCRLNSLIVCIPFPFGVWGRIWNSIVSVPDHCLFIYVFICERIKSLTYFSNNLIQNYHYCLACYGKHDIYWIGFVSDFGAKLAGCQ